MALNKCIFLGRIANDLEIKQTPSGVSVLTFSIAVDRNFKNANGEYETDFIKCVAFRSVSEFIGRYFYKGRMIAIDGHLQNRSYQDKNGEKRYITEIIVDSANFTGEKNDGGNYQNNSFNQNNGFDQQNGGGFANQYQQTPQQTQQTNNGFNGDAQSVGDLSEFEDVLIDDGSVPF